jgi:uncharacterized protein YdcH (DUF465 family)
MVGMKEQELKALLSRENRDFQRALEDHRACELELQRIRLKKHLTEADTLAERDLKKRKLALKDKMYRIMQEYGKTR